MPTFPEMIPGGSLSVDQAMRLAIAAAERVRGTTRPNPPVGCVVLDRAGIPVGIAGTEPPGGPHAEPQALAMAGARAAGGTVVVTLEPCHHQGKTPPCTGAVWESGVRHVVYGAADPNPVASGGAEWLRSKGLEVRTGVLSEEISDGVLRPWLHWQRTRTPHITLKTAGTLDGLAAASDGSSQWITSEQSRARVHVDRSRRDAIIVGTGTVLADDPRLTARLPDGSLHPHQPLRVAVGHGLVPESAKITGENFRQIQTRDMEQVVEVLADLGVIDVLIEGGPRIAGAFVKAGLVDAVESYVAPSLLGAGTAVVDFGEPTTLTDRTQFRTTLVKQLGDDIFITAVRRSSEYLHRS